ncbi:MAG: cobalamin-dependent protein [Rhodothermales bacterium]|nr:cobalamin-dependent protein [Rhodothermales bacterium]MBO6780131.1 cobalamin-dependent protein [Rhodothermales bacterium]
MTLQEALPRRVRLTRIDLADVEQTVVRAAGILMQRFPEELSSDAPLRGALPEHGARHLEHFDLAIEAQDDTAFVEYARWVGRVLVARGLSHRCLRAHFQVLADLVEESETPAQVAAETRRLAGLPETDLFKPDLPKTWLSQSEEMQERSKLLLDRLVRGDHAGAVDVVRRAHEAGADIRELYLGLVQPVMYSVGRLWQDNQITWQEEHTATAILPAVFAYCRQHMQPEAPAARGTVVLSGVDRELHDIGLSVLADVLKTDGWRVRNLGGNNPHDVITGTMAYERPVLVGLSVTLPINMRPASEVIARIRADSKLEGCPVVVGGGAFEQSPHAWRRIGADALCRGPEDLLRLLKGDSDVVGGPVPA